MSVRSRASGGSYFFRYPTGKKHEARSCGTKIRHLLRERAEIHAAELTARRMEPALSWNAYCCRFCDGWHVGRGDGFHNPKRFTGYESTLLSELGDRAYWCGYQESSGPDAVRLAVLAKRFRSLARRRTGENAPPVR